VRSNISIFLAEDDDDDASLFKEAVTELVSDVNLVILSNGEQLMRQLETNEQLPDIIFLDLNMPVKNGLDCLKEIKSSSLWKSIKVVVLSTTSDDIQIKKCYSLGADVFVTKPPSYDKLKLHLKSCLL